MQGNHSFLFVCHTVNELLLFPYAFLQFLQQIPEVALLLDGHRDPSHVDLFADNHALDHFFQSCFFGLFVQVVQVEHVVPQFVVLLDVVRFQIQALLLEGLLLDAADEALTFLVVEHFFPLDSEGCKFIDEDTPEDILEEHAHDDYIYHIVGEPACFEGIHILADLLLDV